MYKLFLTIRYLRKRRIAYFAIAAVTLCVAMVLIVMSVMGGWLDQVKVRARGLLGDIIVDNRDPQGFPLYAEFIEEIRQWPEIEMATPVIYSQGLLSFPDTQQTNAVQVVGLRLDEAFQVNAFKQSLYYDEHYPGTTTLAPQQMPVMGVDVDQTIRLPDGEPIHPPLLPEPLQTALEKARAAGVTDDAVPNDFDEMLAEMGLPPIPGVFDGPYPNTPPRWTGEPYPGLIIGRELVARREPDGRYKRWSVYPRGTVVMLSTVAISLGEIGEPIKQPFRLADDSRTGIYEIDSKHVYCDFDLLQKLLDMQAVPRADGSGVSPGRASQIQINIADGVNPFELATRLQKHFRNYRNDPRFKLDAWEASLLGRVTAETWEQSQSHVIGPVEKERILVTILFSIISMVAVALVLCILYMIVLEKTRDIGIIKSIGGSSAGVSLVFVIYGAAVGTVGAILGSVLGVLFVRNINEIQDFLIRINPAWRVWDLSVYSFDRIPSQVDPYDLVTVVVLAIVASAVGSVAAAIRAGGMEPVEALRYE